MQTTVGSNRLRCLEKKYDQPDNGIRYCQNEIVVLYKGAGQSLVVGRLNKELYMYDNKLTQKNSMFSLG
jgi:hypothetical protein